MDILFVIDDSGSMGEEQANLTANFPRFIDVLDTFMTEAGTALDYRIGVTTTGKTTTSVFEIAPIEGFTFPPEEITELGPGGALLHPPSCDMSRPWIEREDAEVARTFSCVARVGTTGSSIEMPLHMFERALTDKVEDGTNAGFLREDALLAVVILTDEDDCSQEADRFVTTVDLEDIASLLTVQDQCDPATADLISIDHILATIDEVKGDRGRWAAAVIAGPGPGLCESEFGTADEATRLRQFQEMAGENATFSSICEGDLSSALMDALSTFDAACQNFPPLI